MSVNSTHSEEDSVPFYPDHVKTELHVVIGVLVVVGIVAGIALFAPVGLGEPADPMNTPVHVKPEWYFLALYQLLKYVPKTAGAVFPVLAVLLILFWPFIDRKKDKTPKEKILRLAFVSASLIVLIGLTIWGGAS